MGWDGMGWDGMGWGGVGWCGVVWCGVVWWCGAVWCSVVWCGLHKIQRRNNLSGYHLQQNCQGLRVIQVIIEGAQRVS